MKELPTSPIPIAALGRCTPDGERVDPTQRVSRWQTGFALDESICFGLRNPPQPEWNSYWARLPGFLLRRSEPAHTYAQVLQPHVSFYSGNALFLLVSPDSQEQLPIVYWQDDMDESSARIEAETLESVEELILSHNLTEAAAIIDSVQPEKCTCPRLLFSKAIHSFIGKDFLSARNYFHKAMLFGHPDALAAEWAAISMLGKKFRDSHPEIFHALQHGEPLRVLTQLRALIDQEVLHAGAALAYSLRRAKEPEEGVHICERVLQEDELQSDVYGHLWSFLTELKRDEDALLVAQTHLSHYPTNPQAYTDALHSALLVGEYDLAHWYAQGYLINTVNLHTALKNLFTCAEHTRSWSVARKYFEWIIPTLRAPTPKTLYYYAEVLIEENETSDALEVLEQALRAAPDDIEVVLAIARAHARLGNIEEGIHLLETVRQDQNRHDDLAQQYLIQALLSELYRNNSQLAEALALWPAEEGMDRSMLDTVGARPFVEYAYCLAENAQLSAAKRLLALLNEQHFDQYVVQELDQKLCALH